MGRLIVDSIEDFRGLGGGIKLTLLGENLNVKSIKKVIFNDPATIVFWKDGSKTVVKSINEPFDPEKGLAMAIAKKAFGNKGKYYNIFKKFLPKEEKIKEVVLSSLKFKRTKDVIFLDHYRTAKM